ncbi:MAG TPA: methionyl-tRNA formyltransferase [Firmicutes bacterium]|nr:methionyl-tRNA formyltransferase [Bacillota bacterium]
MRLVFMGTPEFAVPSLKALLASGHEVAGVVTQPDRPRGRGQKETPSPVKQVAIENGLELYQPEKVGDPGFIATLRRLGPEVIVVVAFGQKIPGEILAMPRYGCINVHGSLLPKYRGASPMHRAIMNGEKITGVTTMYLAERWDAGDIILQETVEIPHDMTVGELHDEIARRGADLLVETLRRIEAGDAPRTPQNEADATYAPKLRPEEARIEWARPSEDIRNQIRGMNPRPGAYTRQDGKMLKILEAQVVQTAHGAHAGVLPGTVIAIDKKAGFVVKTGDGALLVTRVQPEGGRVMSAPDYMLGHEMREGLLLGD